ncbi:adenosylcobinamide-GDP ribazoletransferase [Lentilitoribacter sp. Alg239-R112]|jgi:adenosylcobinamide-GDP ribazoletransferase|uniref:adenosylcobinamide-GDP ribazoletransferase n=1 Tax=Lentilitoribacter sp. Alg239-R112 TaxID=2305987 RepID=UPI0013A68EA9|nr:adenosylcobinamide-GDP ribazoletransferase [Lentilitoribacter sp. Alg239-R112]
MENYLQRLARSIGFLSRYPVPTRYFHGDDGSLGETSGMFALSGVIIALPIACIAALLSKFGTNEMLIAVLVLAMQTFITGALHEDGLSDCVDGFWGGRNKEHILEIMRDSRLGAYGTLALIFSILLKFVALSTIIDQVGAVQLFILIPAISGISRAVMVWHWRSLPPARQDGVAKQVGIPTQRSFNENMIASIMLIALPLIFGYNILNIVIAIPLTISCVYLFTKLADKKINGHTGDTIGATQQISEAALLFGFASLA